MVLIYIDQAEQQIKKSSLEAISYGAALAKQLGVSAEGILLGTVTDDLASLGKYGLQKLHQVGDASLNHFDAKVFTQVLTEAAKAANASVLVFAHNLNGKAIAPAVAVAYDSLAHVSHPRLSNLLLAHRGSEGRISLPPP